MTATADALFREACRRNLDIERLGWRGTLLVRSGEESAWLFGSITQRTSYLGVLLAGDKLATKVQLERQGLPVCSGWEVATETAAIDVWRNLARSVVIKPSRHGQGRGVRAGLDDATRIGQAFRYAMDQGGPVMVEPYLTGQDIRFLIVDGRMIAAARRIPASVLGNGVHNIRTLILELNAGRGSHGTTSGHFPLKPVACDTCLDDMLAQQGWTLDTVPLAGQRVALRSIASVSRGATAVDVTAAVHPDLTAMAIAAAAAIGLDVAGVDILVPDPASVDNAIVIEVNAAPGFGPHLAGPSSHRTLAGAVLDYLLPGTGAAS